MLNTLIRWLRQLLLPTHQPRQPWAPRTIFLPDLFPYRGDRIAMAARQRFYYQLRALPFHFPDWAYTNTRTFFSTRRCSGTKPDPTKIIAATIPGTQVTVARAFAFINQQTDDDFWRSYATAPLSFMLGKCPLTE